MNNLKKTLLASYEYAKTFLKWVLLAAVIGIVGGAIGSLFHESVEYVTHLRGENGWLLFLLPAGGLVIAAMYGIFRKKGDMDTNRVLNSVGKDASVPLVMAPLIFLGTVLTHLFGGSAGREGAALQLGGSIGYNVGKAFKLRRQDMHLVVRAGMSAVFAALFGTPLTAAFFALEVVRVGVLHYAGLVPCLVSSIVAYGVSKWFGVEAVQFLDVVFPFMSVGVLAKTVLLALLCALISILFCVSIHKSEHYFKRWIKNPYVRAFLGGAAIVLLTLVLNTHDYNGAGMNVIARAMGGTAHPFAFLLKLIFTAITIGAGFKGGEIVPAFFVGATFGCVAGGMLGLPASFGAAVGFVALFCGAVNCPVASILLAFEVFGGGGMLAFSLCCGVSYMLSGYFGLYKSQTIVYSKLDEEKVNREIQ